MYGVTYFWDGKKFHTVVKDKKVSFRKRFKQKLLALGCDWKLYSADDNNEVTRMNAIAWLEIMKYIQRRLKTKMYWLDKKANIKLEGPARGSQLKHGNLSTQNGSIEKNAVDKKKLFRKTNDEVDDEIDEELNDEVEVEEKEAVELIKQKLSNVQFPDEKWFKGSKKDLNEQALKLNISPDFGSPKAVSNAVLDATILCTIARGDTTWIDEAGKRYKRNLVLELTQFYFGSPIEDQELALEELIEFFVGVVTGNNSYFFDTQVEEEAEEPPPEPKERDAYVSDEEDIEVDQKALALLDQAGVPQIRDESGRFLPGHSVRKPKQIYSAKYPKLACDTCYAAQSCPKFVSGYLCAYNKLFERFSMRNPQDILDMLFSMVELNGQRIQRVAIFEMLEGGAPDANLSSLMQMQVGMINQVRQVMESLGPRQANPDFKMTIESTNGGGGGILARLFAPMAEKNKANDEVIDGDFKDDEDDDEDAEFKELDDSSDKESVKAQYSNTRKVKPS